MGKSLTVRAALAFMFLACGCRAAFADASGPKNLTPNDFNIINQTSNDGVFSFDYGVPTSPALSLAGLSPDKTATSTSLKPFVVALPSLFSNSTKNASGALDIAPMQFLMSPEDNTFDAYVKDPVRRLENRIRLGIAISDGTDGDGNAKKATPSALAASLSVSLLDDNDPLMQTDWDTCFGENRKALDEYENFALGHAADPRAAELIGLTTQAESDLNGGISAGRDEFYSAYSLAMQLNLGPAKTPLPTVLGATPLTVDQMKEDMGGFLQAINNHPELTGYPSQADKDAKRKALNIADIITNCATRASNAAMFAPALDIGVGALWTGTAGELRDLGSTAATGWLGFRYPFDVVIGAKQDNSQKPNLLDPNAYWSIGGSARYAYQTKIQTGITATPQIIGNVADTWIGLERSTETFRLSAQFGYLDQSAKEASQQKLAGSGDRWLVGAKYQLFSEENGIWLGATYGSAEGSTGNLKGHEFLLTLSVGPAKTDSIFGYKGSDGTSAGSGGKS